MQENATKLTGFTAVISALGFLLRWLQNMNILDKETGLAARGTTISALVVLLIIIVAGAIFGYTVYLRRFDAPLVAEEALGSGSFLFTIFGAAAALLLAVSGGMQLVQAGSMTWPTVHRICGLGTLAGAVGVVLLVATATRPEKAAAHRAGAFLQVIFAALWLITIYKDAAADPVIWHFVVEILGGCGALLALYHVAGYHFFEPKPMAAIFWCYFGGFLCFMAAIDENALSMSLTFAAVALLLFVWGHVLVLNLRRAGGPIRLDEDVIRN